MPKEPAEVFFTPIIVRYSLEPQELKRRHTLYRFRFEWQTGGAEITGGGNPAGKIGRYLEFCRQINPPAEEKGSRSKLNATA